MLTCVRLFATPPIGLLCAWESPGKNTEVGCHAVLQEIFPTQGSNPHLLCLLHGKWILCPLNHQGSPFCILVVLKFTQTILFGAPWSRASLWPLTRRADPQLPSSQPPLSSDTHILCAADHQLRTGLSVPTAASSPGLCLAVPSPGMPPLLDIAPSGTGARLPVCLHSWTRGVLRVGAALVWVLAQVPGTDPKALGGVLVSDQVQVPCI